MQLGFHPTHLVAKYQVIADWFSAGKRERTTRVLQSVGLGVSHQITELSQYLHSCEMWKGSQFKVAAIHSMINCECYCMPEFGLCNNCFHNTAHQPASLTINIMCETDLTQQFILIKGGGGARNPLFWVMTNENMEKIVKSILKNMEHMNELPWVVLLP